MVLTLTSLLSGIICGWWVSTTRMATALTSKALPMCRRKLNIRSGLSEYFNRAKSPVPSNLDFCRFHAKPSCYVEYPHGCQIIFFITYTVDTFKEGSAAL